MKKAMFKDLVYAFILLSLIFASFNSSWAAEKKYPSRTIEIICSMPPGGPIDLLARMVSTRFEKEFGIPVVTVNKPGGGGSLAGEMLAKAPTDGYTLALMAETSILMPILLKEATFSLKDFNVIGQINEGFATFFIVHPDSPWKTFKEFIDYAKQNPGVRCGQPPNTTTTAIKFSYINKASKLGLVGVPFKSDPETFAAILGKHVPIAAVGVGGLKGLVEAGKIRVLFSFYPAAEIGLDPAIPDYKTFFGEEPMDFPAHLWVPAKTPIETVKILRSALEKVVKSSEFQSDLRKIQLKPYFKDGDIIMKEVLPNHEENLKKILTDVGLVK